MTVLVNAWNISASVSNGMFSNNNTVVNIDCNNINWLNNTAANAFSNCQNLYSVIQLSNTITNLANAFENCPNFTAMDYLPYNTMSLAGTFKNCQSLTNIPVIPNSVVNMTETFYNAKNFTGNNLTLPPNVKSLGGTFINTALTIAPDIPNSVTNMVETFMDCKALTTTPTIPDSIVDLTRTFKGCKNLTLPPNLTNSKVTTLEQTFNGCTKLATTPTIPNSVTTMVTTFAGCNSLTTTPNIPTSVTNLYATFNDCHNLTTVTSIPSTVTNLADTFRNCRSLVNVPAIPASVTNVVNTFRHCISLTNEVIILSKEITNARNCFYNANSSNRIAYISFNYINNTHTKTYNAFVAAGYNIEGSTSTTDNTWLRDMDISNVVATSYPTDSTVLFTAPGYTPANKVIVVRKNTPVAWNASRWGYVSQTGNLVATSDNESITVTLQKGTFTLTVTPNPADAIVTLTTSGATQSGNSITAEYEKVIHWKVEKTGYFTQEGDIQLINNINIPVELIRTHYDITINPTPSDALVAYNGVYSPNHTISAPYQNTITWAVTKDGYINASGTITDIKEDAILPVTLTSSSTTITTTNTPNTYSITLPNDGFYEVTLIGGGGGTASTGKGGGSNSGDNSIKSAVKGS